MLSTPACCAIMPNADCFLVVGYAFFDGALPEYRLLLRHFLLRTRGLLIEYA